MHSWIFSEKNLNFPIILRCVLGTVGQLRCLTGLLFTLTTNIILEFFFLQNLSSWLKISSLKIKNKQYLVLFRKNLCSFKNQILAPWNVSLRVYIHELEFNLLLGQQFIGYYFIFFLINLSFNINVIIKFYITICLQVKIKTF